MKCITKMKAPFYKNIAADARPQTLGPGHVCTRNLKREILAPEGEREGEGNGEGEGEGGGEERGRERGRAGQVSIGTLVHMRFLYRSLSRLSRSSKYISCVCVCVSDEGREGG